jgi:hypothetical protein
MRRLLSLRFSARLRARTAWLGFLLLVSSTITSGTSKLSIIVGTWSDACPCEIPCQCWSTLQSSTEFCVNFHVFKIQNGTYDDVNLAQSIFVLENIPRAPRLAPKTNTLIIGTTDQRKASAIEHLVRQVFSFKPRNIVLTNITMYDREKYQEVSIPGRLHYRISFTENRPLADQVSEHLYPWLSEVKQGTVKNVIYSPPDGQRVEYSGTNALSGVFRVRAASN